MRLFQIDAFADAPFTGNPAAVCLLDGAGVEQKWMQDVAAEMNLSETAFVRREDGDWSLRWFSPTVEIALCGHATLATAHALLEEGLLAAGDMTKFSPKSGVRTAYIVGSLNELGFHATDPSPSTAPEG